MVLPDCISHDPSRARPSPTPASPHLHGPRSLAPAGRVPQVARILRVALEAGHDVAALDIGVQISRGIEDRQRARGAAPLEEARRGWEEFNGEAAPPVRVLSGAGRLRYVCGVAAPLLCGPLDAVSAEDFAVVEEVAQLMQPDTPAARSLRYYFLGVMLRTGGYDTLVAAVRHPRARGHFAWVLELVGAGAGDLPSDFWRARGVGYAAAREALAPPPAGGCPAADARLAWAREAVVAAAGGLPAPAVPPDAAYYAAAAVDAAGPLCLVGAPAAAYRSRGIALHLGVVLACAAGRAWDGLRTLAGDPGRAARLYLPGMPEDQAAEVFAAAAAAGVTTWMQCPNGHRYGIGDCGQGSERARCPECGAGIGAGRATHTYADGNAAASTADTTRPGHCVGAPGAVACASERGLPCAVLGVLRCLVHAALLLACTGEGPCATAAAVAVRARVPPGEAAAFYQAHLEHDLAAVARALERSGEDACILVHTVLARASASAGDWACDWATRPGRAQWERTFRGACVDPLMTELSQRIDEAVQWVAEGAQDGAHARLVRHAQGPPPADGKAPALWARHMSASAGGALLQMDRARTTDCPRPCLRHFLESRGVLPALAGVPAIARLLRCLVNRLNRRVSRDAARRETVAQTIETWSAAEQDAVLEGLAALAVAWQVLEGDGRAPAPPTPASPLAEVLPARRSAMSRLQQHLITAHNGLVYRGRDALEVDVDAGVQVLFCVA